MAGLLFDTPDYKSKANEAMHGAASSMSKMGANTKTTTELPGKTAGAAVMSGVGGAAAGASIGSAMATGATTGSAGGIWGAAIGAIVGLGAYYLS